MIKDDMKKDENLENTQNDENINSEKIDSVNKAIKEKAEKVTKVDESVKSDESIETEEVDKDDSESLDEKEIKEEDREKEESDRYIRLMADFQNYKNRVEKQKSEIYSFANEKIITKLLEVLDNFDRALLAEAEKTPFKEGMEMILKQLESVLVENGLSEISAKDEDFDPNRHNAVMVDEVEGVEENKVVEVFQKGYTLNGKVIRPSMVKVSK